MKPNKDNELREQILSLPRPTPQEATRLVEAELEDLLTLIQSECNKARVEELESLNNIGIVTALQKGNGFEELSRAYDTAIKDRIKELEAEL